MKTLDRYMGSRTTVALGKALAALVVLFILIDLLTHRRPDILKYDVPFSVTARYYLHMTPWIIGRMAPLAMLLAALMVFGSAAQDNEITAALAGGVGLWRLVRLPIVIAFALAVAVVGMNETFGAPAKREANRIDAHYFTESPLGRRDGVSWANLENGWTCHIEEFNRIALTGENVALYRVEGGAFRDWVRADRIFWKPEKETWLLEDGTWVTFEPGTDRIATERITQREGPLRESPGNLFALEEPYDAKTARQLLAEIRRAERRRMPVRAHWVNLHAKFSQPALAFVMIGLAIPFAIRLRRGGVAIGFGISVAIAITYLTVFWIGMALGFMGYLPPAAAAWFANGLFLAVGAALLARTPT